MPSFIHKQGSELFTDIHRSKLNLAAWIRRGKNIRNPMEVSTALRGAYDFLFACAYQDYESGYYSKYLSYPPETVRESLNGRLTVTGKQRR